MTHDLELKKRSLQILIMYVGVHQRSKKIRFGEDSEPIYFVRGPMWKRDPIFIWIWIQYFSCKSSPDQNPVLFAFHLSRIRIRKL